jgi:predicted amino acid racemase
VGESLFLGTDVYNDTTLEKMHSDAFRLYSEIIELSEKPVVPMGDLGTNVEGKEFDFNEEDIGQTTYRAILDLGLLDVDKQHITPIDEEINYLGGSSDMMVVDLGRNEKGYKVGDLIEFRMDYMGTLRAINSKYIEKRVK